MVDREGSRSRGSEHPAWQRIRFCTLLWRKGGRRRNERKEVRLDKCGLPIRTVLRNKKIIRKMRARNLLNGGFHSKKKQPDKEVVSVIFLVGGELEIFTQITLRKTREGRAGGGGGCYRGRTYLRIGLHRGTLD